MTLVVMSQAMLRGEVLGNFPNFQEFGVNEEYTISILYPFDLYSINKY